MAAISPTVAEIVGVLAPKYQKASTAKVFAALACCVKWMIPLCPATAPVGAARVVFSVNVWLKLFDSAKSIAMLLLVLVKATKAPLWALFHVLPVSRIVDCAGVVFWIAMFCYLSSDHLI